MIDQIRSERNKVRTNLKSSVGNRGPGADWLKPMKSGNDVGTCKWHLLDIPLSLTPQSCTSLSPRSSAPPTEPYKLAEPKGKGLFDHEEAWGQLHVKVSRLAERALMSARETGNEKWCNPRDIKDDPDDDDIRPWGKMLQLNAVFESFPERSLVLLSEQSEV